MMKKSIIIIPIILIFLSACMSREVNEDEQATSNQDDKYQNIDSRVLWINQNLEEHASKISEAFEDYHIDGTLVKRCFYIEIENERDAADVYELYYDDDGSLIYAEITHYRSLLYTAYFHKDKLIYVYFHESSELNGDYKHIESLIKEDQLYSVFLDDERLILDYAYKNSSQP